ncbi:4-amino-4-deoxy-L-arabinose-phosphoundecaprenol flippase subunit ArnE [Candidatus Methanoplasma termitum]|uniref:ArnE protein n=1 Tax=Candidatus Methanoplasma termitum TaxID=1577791 RepID=A0A0A7LCN2_9ARCH|nr:EamA family transporter [Candidatus Methanoplasma termitum]AIZ56758.1 4-amino-4-deoxy-L-arabinose-phosphoundecaprenol flippase subunit ArnE [Candidatus Methanoplasma termitum]MCL2333974.1 EamA family transporter [Candidatus Methanoplasma sp.]
MEYWIIFAFASALFAGLTSVLAKIGLKGVDSNLATALRTIVVLGFAWMVVFAVGSQSTISDISTHTLTFLILSGLATGASWLCYFRAIQIGQVNKVTPIDKSSTVLTMVLAFIFLGEGITLWTVAGMILMIFGTFLMIQRTKADIETPADRRSWIIFACLSAFFAALTSILGKVGIEGVEANLGTAIRTIVVLLMAWLIVIIQKRQRDIKKIERKNWNFLILSGVATGLSWLCFFNALQNGPASIVVPIDKLSIVVTVVFAFLILKERLSRPALIGLILLVIGTLVLLL